MSSPTGEKTSSPSNTVKKGKRKKDRKEKENDARHGKDRELEAVTCSFASNKYAGILRQDRLGCRFLEGSTSKYTWENGVQYEGPFSESKINGRGRFIWPDGSTYEGLLENGKRHGEGVYTAADGVTKYDGQWVQGHRHGEGRISYDMAGEAYYFGQWENGWKHGHGRQVWPSGNIYEGQWRFGRIAGEGKMSWFEFGVHEQYSGNWDDDHPQGVGTHTWHAPEPKPDQTIKDGPSQQMNNRYQGQWDNGVRHGTGTFYYANGAKYNGAWDVNVKSGTGTYTFEDGKVYSGNFKHDQMTDYSMPDALNRTALNIGAEDNPVRQCIDVSDLEHFALPPDVGGLDLDEGTGYDETEEVMREVHNTLLRYLGELKQVYYLYRTFLRRQGEDPFVLSSHQLWILARDFDLLTPSCTLSRLSRCIHSGPRHHQEVACEDIEELRPLTPRQKVQDDHSHGRHRDSSARATGPGQPGSAEAHRSASNGQLSGRESLASHRNSVWARDSESSSSASGSSSPASPSSVPVQEEAPHKESEQDSQAAQAVRAESKPSIFMGQSIGSALLLSNLHTPLYTKFWRKEDAKDLVDLHSPSTILMFRHFLESFVRLAMARYPHEKGLEHQTRRLFKETLVPKFGKKVASDWVFAFLLDKDISSILKEFNSPLWTLFKENAVGEGAYAAPPWVSQTEESVDAVRGASTAGSEKAPEAAKRRTSANERTSRRTSHRGSAEVRRTSDRAQGSLEVSKDRLPSITEEQVPAKASRTRRRGFGGQHRRLHLKARLDVTIRVKDILNLLHGAGLLRPPKANDVLPPYATDIHSSMFPDTPDLMGMTRSSGMTAMPDLGGLKGALMLPGMSRGSAGFDLEGQGEMTAPGTAQDGATRTGLLPGTEDVSQKNSTREATGSKDTMKDTRESFTSSQANAQRNSALDGPAQTMDEVISRQASGDDLEGGEQDAPTGTPAPIPEASPSEILVCDFTLTVLEALRFVGEVLSPQSLAKLHWALTGEESPKDERVALLDYVETELAYPEFLRLLFRIAETKTQQLDPALAERLQVHRRLEGFLRHVFLPSLENPYTPPEASASAAGDSAALEASAGSEAVEAAAAAAAAAAAGSSDAAEQARGESAEGEAEEQPDAKVPPRPPFAFWGGFDDLVLEAEEAVAPRMWPEHFEEEVAAW